jgi:hypothetical protein
MARRLAAAVLALLLGIQAVRNAAVNAFVSTDPGAASSAWPSHPEAQLGVAMINIAAAAGQGHPVDAGVFQTIDAAGSRAPLAVEPFLVRGVQAQLSGDKELAQQAFEAAEHRDPRSLPARYFLAEQYLRAGQVARGLTEFAALARLAPNGIGGASPYVAAYARDPSRWPQMRALFRANPDLQEASLEALASDAANAPAILALADSAHRNAHSPWLQPLLVALVAKGRFAEAKRIWATVARVEPQSGQYLFDAAFTDAISPPPFNWTLTSSAIGLAERQPGGRLHVIYYGQDDGVLASQLLILPPGRYRLAMTVSGGGAGGRPMRWALTCANAQAPFTAAGLDALARGPWTFDVPAGCGAQRLDLVGASADIPQQVEVTLSGLSLEPVDA